MNRLELKKLINECIQEILLEKKKDPCWKGYTQYGTKKKDGKEVPNCVPTNENAGCMCGGECNCADKIEEDNDIRNPQSKTFQTLERLDSVKDQLKSVMQEIDRIDAGIRQLSSASISEGGGKCTKANTKKTSSDRKDKKWTKCSQGKRIHWGDPNAKVTGKSGNTKRKKSFRARHKCSTAKKGTAKYQACKDW
jgi:hypothetical protein